jgi:hypothetical protein
MGGPSACAFRIAQSVSTGSATRARPSVAALLFSGAPIAADRDPF